MRSRRVVSSISKPSSLWSCHCPSSSIYILQTSCVLYRSCLSMWDLFQLKSLCQSARVCWSRKKLQHTTRSFWWVSLYGVLTNPAHLCNVRQTNTCMLLTKNPSSCVLSHACFSRTSFHLCLLQLNVPSCVCLSKTPSIQLSKNPQVSTSKNILKEILGNWMKIIWMDTIRLHCTHIWTTQK